MGTPESTVTTPPVDHLRERCAAEGVTPADDDLRAAAAFLDTILPLLAELERELPVEQAPAGLFHPDLPS